MTDSIFQCERCLRYFDGAFRLLSPQPKCGDRIGIPVLMDCGCEPPAPERREPRWKRVAAAVAQGQACLPVSDR